MKDGGFWAAPCRYSVTPVSARPFRQLACLMWCRPVDVVAVVETLSVLVVMVAFSHVWLLSS